MDFICSYVLIQKSGQKTAKSHLCALGTGKATAVVQTKPGNLELVGDGPPETEVPMAGPGPKSQDVDDF